MSGIFGADQHDGPPTALFHNADIAMYHAKTSRTGTAIAYRMDHRPSPESVETSD